MVLLLLGVFLDGNSVSISAWVAPYLMFGVEVSAGDVCVVAVFVCQLIELSCALAVRRLR